MADPFKRMTLTPAQAADMTRDGKRLGPGIWLDRHGDVHFSVPELLEAFGWPNDEEHRGLVMQVLRDTLPGLFPMSELIQTEPES